MLTNRNDAFGMIDTVGMEQSLVDEAEDRRIGADRNGKSEDHGYGKSGRLPECARGMAQILAKRFQTRQTALLAAGIQGRGEVSKFQSGLMARLGGFHASAQVFLGE
jgi:hypothetical protein